MATSELATSADIEEFLHCGLLSWLELYLPKPEIVTNYTCLLDGTVLHNVWLTIDPDPVNSLSPLAGIDESQVPAIRAKNFELIVENIQQFYLSELQQIVLKLPDCFTIGFKKHTRCALQHLKLLITLMLGAAVQCRNKESFIAKIKQMDIETQYQIVQIIKLITDDHKLVLAKEALSDISKDVLFDCLTVVQRDRNKYYSLVLEVTGASPEEHIDPSASLICDQSSRQIDDLQSKTRDLRQKLAEKSDKVLNLKIELHQTVSTLEKLQSDSREWYKEAQRAVEYRDELDALKEKADKADYLKSEIQKLREKLAAAKFYKIRAEELRDDNQVLLETKIALEAQLKRIKDKYKQMSVFESQVKILNRKLEEMVSQRGIEQVKHQELIEENTRLRLANRMEVTTPRPDLNTSEGEIIADSNPSLADQLKNSLQTNLLSLELENQRLLALIEETRTNTAGTSCDDKMESAVTMQLVHKAGEQQVVTEERDELKGQPANLGCPNLTKETITTAYIQENFNSKPPLIEMTSSEDILESSMGKSYELPEKHAKLPPTECNRRIEIVSSDQNHQATLTALISKVSMLESKVNVLQKQNNQLTTTKEDLTEQVECLKQGHKIVSRDQNRFRRKYERLCADYESVTKDRDRLQKLVFEIKKENIDLKNVVSRQENLNVEEIVVLKAEHSKLTADFCELFATCEQYKSSYEALCAEHEAVQNENESFKRQVTELSFRIESVVNAENDYTSLSDRCEMLLTMNANLTQERRILMDNVSQLLAQYHELLSHSLEDKQHYHESQQEYQEQVSLLNKQKERLEMKIMDQYKTPDSSGKKKENSLIKRMKRASCDFMSKSRKSWTDESSSTPSKLQQNDSESVSPCSEHTSDSPQSSRARLDSIQDGQLKDNEHIEYNETSDVKFFVGSLESDEPYDSLEPGYRKPIYSNLRKIN